MKNEDEYIAQIEKMADNVNAWRAANSGADAVVQFNYPKGVMLIMLMSEAIKTHFVYANGPGQDMLKAMWSGEPKDEPTVFMARMVLEIADDRKGRS